ncbi:MAG TPA: peptidylprolyl isomerase [Pseudolysinimonas sp.]|nr:peptidylprolyl isomerase [Pseudolysinimonas sp.]
MASRRQEREQRAARDRLKVYTARQQVHARGSRRRIRDNLIGIAGAIVIVGLAATTQIFYFQAGPGAPTPKPSASAAAASVPKPSLSENRTWTGTLTLNNKIPLGVELNGAAAPQAVAVFVQASQDDYYLGKTCHRLVIQPTFQLLQCGSIDGTGAPDPKFSYGPIENAPADNFYPAGTIAMARGSNDAASNGHQFFIVTADTTIPADTAGGYSVVGKVTSGLDALVDRVVKSGVNPSAGGNDGPPSVATAITGFTLQ